MKIKDYKDKFPFKIGTTSYIFPIEEDNIVANVTKLHKKFDKIQLLFFGKEYVDDMMTPDIIDNLRKMRDRTGVEYSIHLPLDLGLLEDDESERERGLDIIEHVYDKTAILGINEFILHIDHLEEGHRTFTAGESNRELFHSILENIQQRFEDDMDTIYVENVSYDLASFNNELNDFPCSICMDIGHLHKFDYPMKNFIKTFGKKIREVHLHGFNDTKEHRSLTLVDRDILKEIEQFLKKYTKSVIIEVFDYNDLIESLDCLETLLHEKKKKK